MSYSHEDKRFATALHEAIEAIAKPRRRSRRITVFRDETELRLDQSMPASISRALVDAQWLILVVSPASAKSTWVKREIDEFLTHRPPSSVLLVLAEGRLEWDEARREFRDADCPLPLRLRTAYADEPVWSDFTWRRTNNRLDLSDRSFRDAVAKVAAPIRNVSPGNLARAHATRPLRRAIAAVAIVAVLVAAGVGAAAVRRSTDSALSHCQPPPTLTAGQPLLNEGSVARISDASTASGIPFAVEQVHDALIAYRSSADVDALLKPVQQTLTVAQYQAAHVAHRVPSDTRLFRERLNPGGGPGRLFLDARGAVYEITDASSLQAIGMDPADALVVPEHAFEHEDYEPRTGTLLHVRGSPDIWKVNDSIERVRITDCTPTDVVELPNSPHVLARVPIAAADHRNPGQPQRLPRHPTAANVSPVVTVTACDWDPDRELAHVSATLQNVSTTTARYSVKVRLFSERGPQGAANPHWYPLGVVRPGAPASYEQTWKGSSAMKVPRCRFFVDARAAKG